MVKLEDKVKELEDRIKSLEDRMNHGWVRHEYIPPNRIWPWPQPSHPFLEPYAISASGEITYSNNQPVYQVSQWAETDKPVG